MTHSESSWNLMTSRYEVKFFGKIKFARNTKNTYFDIYEKNALESF